MSDTSELTLLLLRVAFLALLWVFVFIVIYALRSDLFGTKLTRLQQQAQAGSAARANGAQAAPAPGAAPAAPVASPDAQTTVTSLARGQRGGRAQTAAAMPARHLVVVTGPKAGLELDLPSTGLTIGRASGAGLQIKDDYTSSNHARLTLRGNDWYLEDLGSTNGTFVDGRRVSAPVAVAIGTPVKIGTTTFELRR